MMQWKTVVSTSGFVLMAWSVANGDVPPQPSQWSSAQQGLEIGLVIPPQSFASGTSMPVRVVIKNVSGGSIKIRLPKYDFYYTISILRGVSEIPKRPIDNSNRGFTTSGERATVLAPGDTDTETIYLEGDYALAPGSYLLKIALPVKGLDIDSEAILVAPTATLTVE